MRVTSLLWQKAKKNHEPVDEGERESGKAGLKLNIQKTRIMASGCITSWQIDGETIETVTDFIFLGSKITADSDCSHKIKKMLAPWMKSYDKPRQLIKNQTLLCQQRSVHSKLWLFQ